MMEAEYSEIQMVMMDGGNTFGASAVHFDTEQELLWAGNLGVSNNKTHINNYVQIMYNAGLLKYLNRSSFPFVLIYMLSQRLQSHSFP